MKRYGSMWQADLAHADEIFRQALTSRIITAKHAALAMMRARRGLIVEVTENDLLGLRGNPMTHVVKVAQKALPLHWAAELEPHGIAVVSLTPGFLRLESVLQHFGVTEANWRARARRTRTSSSPSRRSTSGAPSRRSPPIRTHSAARVCSTVPGNSRATTSSPTTTAGVRTGAGTRSTGRGCRRRGSSCSRPPRSWRFVGMARYRRERKSSAQRYRLDYVI